MFKNFLLFSLLILRFPLFADSEGENLEKQLWQDVKEQKWDELDKKIAPYFQLAMYDSVLNREQYLNFAKTLKMGEYFFSNINVTEGPDLKVITYEVAVTETIEGKQISSKAVRLSVWKKTNDLWQWISHAILIPVAEKKS